MRSLPSDVGESILFMVIQDLIEPGVGVESHDVHVRVLGLKLLNVARENAVEVVDVLLSCRLRCRGARKSYGRALFGGYVDEEVRAGETSVVCFVLDRELVNFRGGMVTRKMKRTTASK